MENVRDALGRFPKNDITGAINVNKHGLKMKVIKYVNSDEIYVNFLKYNEIKRTTSANFRKGAVKSEKYIEEKHNSKIGEINFNNKGEEMRIIAFRKTDDIDIIFPQFNEVAKHIQYSHFKSGDVKSIYSPNVYGVGFLGTRDKINKHIWKIWSDMLERCYTDRYSAYNNCTVCKEWHNYYNFATWYSKHMYKINERLELDKDVLRNGEKFYSPNTCLLIPCTLNRYIATATCRKKDGLPTGVYLQKNKKYKVIKNFDGRQEKLFNNLNDAYEWYLINKNNHFQKILLNYENKIPKYIYTVLQKYEIK
ncbi:hypothetical protein FJ641_09325 [Clostridium perfringens]|nr:hypothetical protein [Clostridium perfringens]